jgi:hypothetical protein
VQKPLGWIYPAQDKIAVFMMACLLLALLGVDTALRADVADLMRSYFREAPVSASVFFLGVMIAFIGALALPFARSDAWGMIMVNAVVLCVGNVVAAYHASGVEAWLNGVFAVYFAGWVLVIRFGRERDLIARRRLQPMEALLAVALCAAVLAVCTGLLGMSWFTTYSLACVIAPAVHAVILQLLHIPITQEER